MGWFRRSLFGTPKATLLPATVSDGWDSDGGWNDWGPPFNAAREGYHQEAIVGLLSTEQQVHRIVLPLTIHLIREPTNPYDRFALRIEAQGAHVAYLRATIAAQVSPALDAAGAIEMWVPGVLVGGGHRHYGIHLWPDRRLSPGVTIPCSPEFQSEMSWPP